MFLVITAFLVFSVIFFYGSYINDNYDNNLISYIAFVFGTFFVCSAIASFLFYDYYSIEGKKIYPNECIIYTDETESFIKYKDYKKNIYNIPEKNVILDSSFYIQQYINSTYLNTTQDTTYSIKFIDTHNENN